MVALLLGFALFLFWLIGLLSGRIYLSAVLVSLGMLATFNWASVGSGLGLAVLAIAGAGALYVVIGRPHESARYVAVVGVALLIGLPIIQLISSHVQDRSGYPLLPQRELADPVAPSGDVEDVVIVVVDGYPMPLVAREWFGHDTSQLRSDLQDHGFRTSDISWSHNTYTSLAIPTMLEMGQAVTPGEEENWKNLKPNYDRTRGHNTTVRLLTEAGFNYVHIESGWNGDRCGSVNVCLKTSWLDEANWQLLSSSVFAGTMESIWGSQNVANSRTTLSRLEDLEILGDGSNDLVYAHFMLPHSPFVVDGQCELRDPIGNSEEREDPARISDQLTCVDRMLATFLETLDSSTAVVVTGDHGTASLGQLSRPAAEWTDAEIAERLGAFLAYRLPRGCPEPEFATNASAVAAVVGCAVGRRNLTEPPQFVLGLSDQQEVPLSRLGAIELDLRSGEVNLDQ